MLEEPVIVLDGATNTSTVIGKLRHFSYVVAKPIASSSGDPNDIIGLPKVFLTKLPAEMQVNAPIDFSVRVDRGGNIGTVTDSIPWSAVFVNNNHNTDTLTFTPVTFGIPVGGFAEDDTTTVFFERIVGEYTCKIPGQDTSNASVNLWAEAITGIGPPTIINVLYLLNQGVICSDTLVGPAVLVVPQDGAENVPVNTKVTLSFSEMMVLDTLLSDGTVTLHEGDASGPVVPGVTETVLDENLKPDPYQVKFKPNADLKPSTVYTVVVTQDAQTLLGSYPLASVFTSSYKTAAAPSTENSFHWKGTGGPLMDRSGTENLNACAVYSTSEVITHICESPKSTAGFSFQVKGGRLDSFHVFWSADNAVYFAKVDCSAGTNCGNARLSVDQQTGATVELVITNLAVSPQQPTGPQSTATLDVILRQF